MEDEDFFGFSETPLDVKDFTHVQTDLFNKVERALNAMEDDLLDRTEEEKALLSQIMKISNWRNLRECLGASLQHKNEHEELQKYIQHCATLFYKELDHPYWSTTQFQYLLHLDSRNPTYWAGYGLCLVDMQDRGFIDEFRLEEKAAIAFIRAARLSVAHVLARTPYFLRQPSAEKLLDQARRYYGNARELVQSGDTEDGIRICEFLISDRTLREGDGLQKLVAGSERLSCEYGHIRSQGL